MEEPSRGLDGAAGDEEADDAATACGWRGSGAAQLYEESEGGAQGNDQER